MIDYALWEVIENGATLPKTKVVKGVTTKVPIITAEEKAQRRLEVKARSTLMIGIPNEHQLTFNSTKDAKIFLEAVEKRFSGNAATNKDGIFSSQDKYVAEILKKFRFTEVKTASTSIETQKPLLKDEDDEEVDIHMYRYQVNPKVSHLHAVKKIFRKSTT
nr:hypothetical protein [Tanacetum cinerariifolium]